ncbi:MAG TPA: Sec-independent protein translocase protein TatB, partial [Casimicrobiaceae bacterium]|nr:Sec-independent protein translocase protein TatB [Casimicrobiaceae bacterium]
MFDIGFSEIVLIAVVALVVLGPERLPKAARTMGLLFGRLQRYVNEVKADISREMELDELRKLQSEMQGAARDLQQTVESAAGDVATGVRNVERQLNEAGADAAVTATPEPAASRAAASVAPVEAEPATVPLATTVPPETPRQAALP